MGTKIQAIDGQPRPDRILVSNKPQLNGRERAIQRIDQFLKSASENGVKKRDLFKVALLVAKVAFASILIVAAVLLTALLASKRFSLRNPLLGPLLGLACLAMRRIK